MPGRSYSSPAYRYGFNGKEKTDEINGNGNEMDFGARIYDSRLCIWMSKDPLEIKYPGLTPYNYCAEEPILFIDPDGKKINPNGLSVENKAVYNQALTCPTFTKLFSALITSSIDVRLFTSLDINPARAGHTDYMADNYDGTHNYIYSENQIDEMVNAVYGGTENENVQGAHISISLNNSFDPNRDNVTVGLSGMAAAGVLFHELWHANETGKDSRTLVGQKQHKNMSEDRGNYFESKLKFLAEFKGSPLKKERKFIINGMDY